MRLLGKMAVSVRGKPVTLKWLLRILMAAAQGTEPQCLWGKEKPALSPEPESTIIDDTGVSALFDRTGSSCCGQSS